MGQIKNIKLHIVTDIKMAKRRHTKAPTRPGKRSATRCGKTPVADPRTVSCSADPPVEEGKKVGEATLVESPTTDELICAICTDIYQEPKLLHCVHTFCGKCIEQLTQHQNNHQMVVCPICRHVTEAG